MSHTAITRIISPVPTVYSRATVGYPLDAAVGTEGKTTAVARRQIESAPLATTLAVGAGEPDQTIGVESKYRIRRNYGRV